LVATVSSSDAARATNTSAEVIPEGLEIFQYLCKLLIHTQYAYVYDRLKLTNATQEHLRLLPKLRTVHFGEKHVSLEDGIPGNFANYFFEYLERKLSCPTLGVLILGMDNKAEDEDEPRLTPVAFRSCNTSREQGNSAMAPGAL
jgi:hypothetical protein